MAAARKIKTIAGRLVRDVERGLDDKERLEAYDEQLWLYYRVLGQKRDSKNKIYSFHAPDDYSGESEPLFWCKVSHPSSGFNF
jgi:IS5 family transposase